MPFHKLTGPVYAWHGGATDPGWGGGSPDRPDHDLPWGPGRPDNELPGAPGHPSHPITLPPLPGIWPRPGEPNIPVVLPPLMPTQPIYIEGAPPTAPGTPSQPIALPPGIYPPLPPDAALPSGKIAILILVVGVGYRWLVYDKVQVSGPPTAQPK